MKRLKVNGLEINRINDKSVGKWNNQNILLTNKNPLIPVTIPTFEWNVSESMLTPEEFNSLALIIPERFLNYINVTYSDSTNVKIANITAKEGYVITKGQTEYKKVYNLYTNASDQILFYTHSNIDHNPSKVVTVKALVDMFPSMLGSDGYLTYNVEAVNYLKSFKDIGNVTVSKRYTKWKDNALSGLGVYEYNVKLQGDNSWDVPNKGNGAYWYVIDLYSYNKVLYMPYIGTSYMQISAGGSTGQNNPTGAIPKILTTTIDSDIKSLEINFSSSAFTKNEYYSTKYYDIVKNRIKPGTGQTVTLHFSDGDVVIN